MPSQSKRKSVDLPESRTIRIHAEDRALHVRRYRVTLNIPDRKTFQTMFVTRGPSRKGLSTRPYKPTALAPPVGVSTPAIVPTSEVLDNSTGSLLEVMQVGIVDADEPAKYGPRGQPSGNQRAQRDDDGNVLDKTVDVPTPARYYAAVTPREDVVRRYYKVYAAVPDALGRIRLYVINIDNVFIFSEFYHGIDLKKGRRDLTKLVGGNIRNAVARQKNAGEVDNSETTDNDDDNYDERDYDDDDDDDDDDSLN